VRHRCKPWGPHRYRARRRDGPSVCASKRTGTDHRSAYEDGDRENVKTSAMPLENRRASSRQSAQWEALHEGRRAATRVPLGLAMTTLVSIQKLHTSDRAFRETVCLREPKKVYIQWWVNLNGSTGDSTEKRM
jgi:hypothetical protein